jgi:hypothetical protein
MSSLKVNRTRIVLVAVGLAAAILAYAIVERSPAREPAAAQRYDPAREAAEAEIFRTGIPEKLEEALGDEFAGVWFEPSTLQLHVGVTSPESRRRAEAVAAATGLSGLVTETPVRFTLAQLGEARERLSRRFGELAGSGRVITALAPDSNSVELDVSSAVPSSQRADLERAAAADEVNAVVNVRPASDFNVQAAEKCAIFKSQEAFCEPTITSGVSIEPENKLGCTSGPLLIRQDRSTGAKATETFVLTAGHCLLDAGGNGKLFSAFPTGGGEKPLGNVLEHFLGGAQAIDAGVIKVESLYWAPAKDPPVSPHRAAWSAEKENEPVNVTKGAKPVKGTVSCFSGRRSGVQCGTVEQDNIAEMMVNHNGTLYTIKEAAEVKLESGKGGKGDSGSPMFSQAETGVIQGHLFAVTLEGGTEEGKIAYFLPLSVSLAKLGTKFQLLTTGNEKRHKGGMGMEAEHAVLTVSSNTTQKFAPKAGGSAIECKTIKIDGATIQSEFTAVETVEFEPTYSECASFLGAAVSVKSNGCKYVLRLASEKTSGTTDVECPAGKSLEFVVGALCTYAVGSQTGLSTVSYANTGSGATREIAASPNLTGVTSTKTGSFVCPAGSSEGTYSGEMKLTGENAGGSHVGVFVD